MMASHANPSQRGFWLTTFLWAIPFGLLATIATTTIAMEFGVTRSGDGGYSAAFWSSISIGMLIFFGFCYLIVPIAVFILGLLRLIFRALDARRSGHSRTFAVSGPEVSSD